MGLIQYLALRVVHLKLEGRITRIRSASNIPVRYHLFEKRDFCEADATLRRRYAEARRFAVRVLDRLQKMPVARRLERLRRWNALPAPAKLRDLAAA